MRRIRLLVYLNSLSVMKFYRRESINRFKGELLLTGN